MKNWVRVLFLIICILVFATGCMKAETAVVTATVTDKQYVKAHTEYGYGYIVYEGKFGFGLIQSPAEYNVTVKFDKLTETFNNKEIYERVQIGEQIEVKLTVYRDSEGNIQRQSLSSN